MPKDAVVLLNMGGPNNLQEVELFLTNMFRDPNILTIKSGLFRRFVGSMIVFFRTQSAQEIYKRIGNKSPLVDHTKKLVSKLQARLGDAVAVEFAMRYTPPFSSEVIERLNEQNVQNIYLIPLYPQYSTTTVKSSLEEFEATYKSMGGSATLHSISEFYKNELYNEAVVSLIEDALAGDDASSFELVFSAHGLPKKVIDNGDPYQRQVEEHIELVSATLEKRGVNFSGTHLAYQSKVGPMEWLSPSLEQTLTSLKNKRVIISPIAFTIDNSETDFELSIDYKERFGDFEEYRVARCPNDSDLFVDALVQIYDQMSKK